MNNSNKTAQILRNLYTCSQVWRGLNIALLISLVLLSISTTIHANDDFAEYYDQVYQIRVIAPQAGSKSSIGSGFQVSKDGLLLTNFHVVASFVQAPQRHQIEYQSHTGQKGQLKLLDFDVVNDLAVLRHSNPSDQYLQFAPDALRKGETVYALGNPRDYGTSLVKGPNNGLVEHSYDSQILFSGSLNPGMSGGPAFNANGQVVGVNVATAGSQLSFLVPAEKAKLLLAADREVIEQDYQSEIARQIKLWQRNRVQELIDQPWPNEMFADRPLFGEIRKDFQCWGYTNDDVEARTVASVSKSCRAGNSLYLNDDLHAGELYFSFADSKSLTLNATQFARSIRPWMSANNESSYSHSTNYQCQVDFLQNDPVEAQAGTDSFTRVTACVRAFKKLPGLYDSLLLVEQVENLQKFVSHLSVSAVEKDQIQQLNRKFLERTR
ncbi:S1C family serine protease [Arenicella xantha]|uniref:Trypsin-like peptidase n=1 Tax=Arenicella xantha TaxID=644221 RepID=A0A395JMD6_9GAMM|nr:serine protease [Arenicella xantha]RBP52804.1 trypsin-like peptidase [Arenicella xantha]